MPILSRLPSLVVSGDTLEWTETVNDYPASDGWTLKVGLLSGAQQEELVSVADGAAHAFTITAATTATWEPGFYVWTSYVTNGAGARHTVGTGVVTVAPNPAVAPADTFARQALELIQTAILGRIPAGRESFTINGQSISKIPASQLEELLSKFEARVAREDRARSSMLTGGKKRRILATFR